jgi:methyltransferase (TIGR00027 family)
VTESTYTALLAAAARAAHLIVDGDPPVFRDTLAYSLLGGQAEELVSYHRTHGGHLVLRGARAAVTTRSRYTEDRLADAAGAGTSQYVILGAGLDSFAYRAPAQTPVTTFEVDHPATQEWKRGQLAAAGIAVPANVRYVPADLETQPLAGALCAAGFSMSRPAFVSWLGVTMYLTEEAIEQTLAAVAGFAPGSEIMMDYMLPDGLRDADGDEYVRQVAPAAAGRGEPWLTFLSPDDASAMLGRHGFAVTRQVSQRDAAGPHVWQRQDALRPMGLSMLAHARLSPAAAAPCGS